MHNILTFKKKDTRKYIFQTEKTYYISSIKNNNKKNLYHNKVTVNTISEDAKSVQGEKRGGVEDHADQ